MQYLVVFGIVLGVNLLPAFGPPTWAILVLYRLNSYLNPVALVAVGAVAAASGRFVLASVFTQLHGHLSEQRRKSLEAVRARLEGGRAKAFAGLALFALSPVPSAQLFEAAGLMKLPLPRFVLAFFAGRLVSYSIYVTGASALKQTSIGGVLSHSLTDWRAIAIQLVLLAAVFALTRIDWAKRLGSPRDNGNAGMRRAPDAEPRTGHDRRDRSASGASG
jgi:uncharacterized membrane protein YdjX (TVP38/TMEM64 family)